MADASDDSGAAGAVTAKLIDRTIVLKTPVQFGPEEITELTLKPNARAFRNFTLPMKDDGTILFQPYELARVGIAMAGRPTAVLDLLDPADMMEVATRAMGFLAPSLAIGTGHLP